MFDPVSAVPAVAAVVAFVAGLVVDHKFNVVLRIVAKVAEVRDGFHAAVAKAEAKVDAVRDVVGK